MRTSSSTIFSSINSVLDIACMSEPATYDILNYSIEQSRAQHETDVCLEYRTCVKKRLSLEWFYQPPSRTTITRLLYSIVHDTQSSRVP
jgi:hypothetical protein